MRARLGTALRALGLLALALLASSGDPSDAAAQRHRPATLTIEPLFGESTLLADAWSPLFVEVENNTRSDQRGTLAVVVANYQSTVMRRELPLDVPAGETRRAIVNVFTGESGSSVRATFTGASRQLAEAETSVDYQPSGQSVVVLGDPPRLRGALLDLDVQVDTDTGVPRAFRYPVGTVRFDASTGDPMLPEAPAAWSSVRVLVASAPALERIGDAQREAMEDWLRTGGRLLVFPRADADLRQGWLGSFEMSGGEPRGESPSPLVPRAGARFALACSDEQRIETFGCSAPFGQGRVYVADYDGTTPGAIEGGAPRALVSAVLAASDPSPSIHTFGRGASSLSEEYWYDAGSYGSLRGSLDPNEGFRPALGLVAIVLLLYVIFVGPLNFRWVQKKNRPALALLTTPAVATACVLILLAVGYIGKGVTMRYRRVELVESVEGQARGSARRFTGLFTTRPGGFELPGGDRFHGILRLSGGAPLGPIHRTVDDVELLVDFRSGLWETTFLREDRIVDLGGAIAFTRDERRLATVRNESTTPLSGAVVVDTNGAVFTVGDVPAGASRDIDRASVATVSRHYLLGPGADGASTVARHTRGDGDAEEELERVRALIRLSGEAFVPNEAPVLYARIPASEASLGEVFSSELDYRWLRVRPLLRGSAVEPAPEPAPDPWAVTPTYVEEDAGVDAGAEAADAEAETLDGGAP